jgi:hypothetical protein
VMGAVPTELNLESSTPTPIANFDSGLFAA